MSRIPFKFTQKDINPFVKKFSNANNVWASFQVFVVLFGFYFSLYFAIQSLLSFNWGLFFICQFFLFGLYLRAYGLMHDCGHGSLFSNKFYNNWVGFILSLILFKSYRSWKIVHDVHHNVSGKLHRRKDGADLPTATVNEFLDMSKIQKLKYKIIRSPLFLLGLLPLIDLFILDRLTISKLIAKEKMAKYSIYFMNIFTLGFIVVLSNFIGFDKTVFLIIPYFWSANSFAVLFFYVSHQYQRTYWENIDQWNIVDDAFLGSSIFQLPFPLDWFCTDIGIHHIHHMSPRIANYNLRAAQRYLVQNFQDDMKEVTTVKLVDALRTFKLKLWDEDNKELVPFPNNQGLSISK